MRRLAPLALWLCVGGCASRVESNVVTQCNDFVQDGTESDVDCGGGSCPACAGGRSCLIDSDCASDVCGDTGRCLDTVAQPVDVSQVLTVTAGAGIDITPGALAGYGITANTSSGSASFRLVWTGDGTTNDQFHEFYGTVYTSGIITSVASGCSGECSFSSDNYLSAPYTITGGQAVDFDSFDVNDLEGFDTFVADAVDGGSGQPVYFDLYVDGEHHPELVFFPSPGTTSGINSPAGIPFGLIASN